METRSAQEPRAVQWLLLGLGVVAFLGAAGVVLLRQLKPFGKVPIPEARANLKSLYTCQMAWYQEKDAYSEDLRLVGFLPELGNRYTYFAAPSGYVLTPADRRGSSPAPSYSIVATDPLSRKLPGPFETFAKTGCPLTPATLPDGTRAGLGVTRSPGAESSAPSVFIGAAAGDIDGDSTLDCWSIATVDRVTASGETISAGQPYNELDDVKY